MRPARRRFRSVIRCAAGLLLALALVACHRALRPGETRIVRTAGDPALRAEAGPGRFIGVSHVCADEAEARRDAELQARQAIIASLQSQVESEVLQQVRLDGQPAEILTSTVEQTAQVRAISRNLVRVQAEAWYIESRERATADGLRPEVQAWCRMRYTPEQHERLLEELLGELGPLVEERSRALGKALTARRSQDALRLAGQATRQLAALDRYQGWTPPQQSRLAILRQQVEDALGGFTLYVEVEALLDGRPVACGLGPALARVLRDRLPFAVMEGRPPDGAAGARLGGVLRLTTRTVTGGLVSCTGQLEATLQDLAAGEVLWRAVEPGGGLADLRDAGGSAEWASRRLLEGPALLKELPEALAAGLERRLLDQP